MAPSESAILNNFLLAPAQLTTVISLEEFTALFPRSQQSSPHVRTLYRDLQRQRNEARDLVAANVEDEAREAKRLRRAVARARREAESHEYDDEMEIERTLSGAASDPNGPKFDLKSILPELEGAVYELEEEVKRLQDQEGQLRRTVSQNIGSFSDLRYGRLANGQLPKHVLESLTDLQEACKQNNNSNT